MFAEPPVAVPPTVPGRRERNKQRMRERIYSAALSLFAEQGFEQTTIEEITERADVARGTFFNHFQHKEELITAWSAHRQARLGEKLQESRSSGDVAESLRSCITALADINEEDGKLGEVMLKAWVRAGLPITEPPHTAEALAEVIRAGLHTGEVAPGVDPVLVGHLLRDAYLGALFRWCRGGTQVNLGIELHKVLDTVLPGITAPRSGTLRGRTGGC